MKYSKTFLSAAILAASTAVTGCAGGGSSAIPGSQPIKTAGHQRGTAQFVISIPGTGTKSNVRRPKYISANTQSVSIVETDNGGAPLAPVVANLTTGSPNCTSGTGGLSCSVSVPANAGSDTFAIATFDGLNATGNKLSTGSLNATIVAGQANTTVPVVLGGIINALKVALADPYAPIGSMSSFTVQATDASGATIIGSYDNPVSVTAGAGVSLAQSSFANSTDASNASLTVLEPSAPVTITATGDGQTGTATLTPGSGVAFYPIGTNMQFDNTAFGIVTGNDGNIYYSTIGATTCSSGLCNGSQGSVGQFNPATHAFSEYDLQSSVINVFQTPDGAIWASEASAQKLARFAPGTFPSAPVEVALTARPRAFALAPDGNSLWVSTTNHQIVKVDLTVPFGSSAVTSYQIARPTGTGIPGNYPYLGGMAFGADGNLYTVDYKNGVVYQINSAGVVANTFTLPEELAMGPSVWAFPRFITNGSDHKLYITEGGQGLTYPYNGALESMTTSGTFARINMPAAAASSASAVQPDQITASGSSIYWDDLQSDALGSLDLTTNSVREVPITDGLSFQLNGHNPNGVAVAPDGSQWFSCYGYTGNPMLCLGHMVLNSTWSVMPSRTVNIYGSGPNSGIYMGIAESGNSGPFTLSSADPTIANPTGIADHNFSIVGYAPGTTTVTVTDAHGRSVTVTVNVTTTNGTVQSHTRQTPRGGNI
jgi:streptogramin lyase